MKNAKNKCYIIHMLGDGKTMRKKQMFIAHHTVKIKTGLNSVFIKLKRRA